MIPTADTQLYTVDTPGGSPPLLFISGGFGTVQNWNRVIERLAGRSRAPDTVVAAIEDVIHRSS
jgi:hypothetical protein